MAVFSYKATDPQRAVVQGTVMADTPRQARELLRARELIVQEISGHRESRASSLTAWRGSGRHAGKLAGAIRELATLLGVGIPLVDALDTVIRQHQGATMVAGPHKERRGGTFCRSLLVLRERITGGASLAEAMIEQPDVFDPLTIHMVEVGENAGNLDQILAQLADFKERSLELKDRVLTALMYPAIVLAASIGVTIFLMTVVVPMLLDNLIEAGRELPWPTRFLKGASDLLLAHGWWLAIGACLLIVAAGAGLRTDAGRKLWCRLLLRVPLVGMMARKQAIARVAMVVAALMKSGIDFVKAVQITARATRNLVLREALDQVSREVVAGHEIGPAMERTGFFSPMVVQIFAVGQQSGRLEEMLERLATDYDRQVSVLSTRLATALEPILILILAVFVGFIMFATVLPILEAGNVL